MTCELCRREVEAVTLHHLVPKERGGKAGPTVELCSACHRQIHSLFDNRRLARELADLDRLREEPRMRRFLAWVRRQDPGKRIKVRQARA